MSKTYRPRIIDDLIVKKLEAQGAVLVEGPKACGKTTTAMQIAKSLLRMDNPEQLQQNLSMAQLNPSRLLSGDTPRLIDEWQLAPKLWDAMRYEIDRRSEPGQFILTGSSVPPDASEILHSGTGRFAWLLMRTMSLFESGESTGDVCLKELFDGNTLIDGESRLSIDDLAFLACRGGWPQAVGKSREASLSQAFDYIDGVIRSDVNRANGMRKDPERVRKLLRSLARNQGGQVADAVISSDIGFNGKPADVDTVKRYCNALSMIFVTEDMSAWNPNLRSKAAIRTTDTRYFVDPSIATASLGLGPEDLLNDLNTFGFIVESLAVRDLRVYAQSLDGTVYHYRDNTGLECDAVIHRRNGSYGLIEIKLGGAKLIEEGALNLLKLKRKIDTTKMKDPSFLMVLTGTGQYPYKREDGVLVIPIGCLKN